MAWDLIIPRFIEKLSYNFGNGQFFIPHYLTWDSDLKEILNLYKAKACIYDDSNGHFVTIPEFNIEEVLRKTVGDHYANKYFYSEAVAKRNEIGPLPDNELKQLLSRVESEFMETIKIKTN